ncbi:MAG TPA: GNAT family N-acetyltransferase [Thermoanaerobaculia bacterium]|jgi:GNAT superfamily N-acetyltransferase
MTIRPARLDDAPAIAVLTAQLGYPNLPEETESRLRDVLDRPDGAVLVAEEEGAVAGWLYVFGIHSIETEPFALIAGLVVDETRRSRGIGAALVGAATDWAAEHGYRTLRVRSNVVRERAHDFYERLGFSRAKNQVVFVRPTASD